VERVFAMHKGKNYKKAKEKIGSDKQYTLEEAVKLLKEVKYAKFDESVDATVRLGVDPKHSEQQVRGTVVMPHGIGKKVRILVLTKGEKEREAKDAGADFVGSNEFIEKIQSGWADVDAIIATPDMMGQVGKLGKILGPKGLMPNPKSGTVTFDIAKAIKELKAGKIEFRVDKVGNIAAAIGKLSFPETHIWENAKTFFDAIMRAKPATVKGTYLKSATLSSTMGPGIKLSTQALISLVKGL
jgi:large subunit ribosomal protein L1